MENDFTIVCPKCGFENDFTEDNWHDELVDDTQTSEIACMSCGHNMEIETVAVYSLKLI